MMAMGGEEREKVQKKQGRNGERERMAGSKVRMRSYFPLSIHI